MSVLASYTNLSSRFNAMTLRERAMVSVALLALTILAWDQLLMNPLRVKKERLSQEITEVRTALNTLTETIEGRAQDNPLSKAMQQKQSLTESLAAVDAQLQSAAAGLIAPSKMIGVLRDMLDRQQGLRLISMRNLPVTSLVPPPVDPNASTKSNAAAPALGSGPYVHSMEIVIDGSYLDVLRYLQSVESLEWRFYWQILDLKVTDYPLNRVRIRLNTLSMDKEWLGV